MKKILFGILLAFMSFSFANASAIEKGSFVIQPDLNLGSYGSYGNADFGIGATVNLDYTVHDYVSVGGFLGINTNLNSGYSYSMLGVGGRGIFHFWNLIDDKASADLKSDKIDFYLPVHLGVHIGLKNRSGSRFNAGVGLGVRYFFNEKIGINLEVGGMEMSWAKIGATIKL